MSFETIVAEVLPDRVGLLTLNRPDKKNALSIAMRREISTCLEAWREAPEVSLVIITGAGSAFSAGFDLGEFRDPSLLKEVFSSSSRYHRDVFFFPKPTIAAVERYAFGGGFDLATLCDVRVCSADAQFGHPEIKFGAPPLFTPLKWIVGHGVARELCFTGRKMDAAEARRLGLVSDVVDAGTSLERAKQLAATILEAPAVTLSTTKTYMAMGAGAGFEESFVAEHDAPFQSFLSAAESTATGDRRV